MGFLMNMIIAQLVHRGDQHRHHVARHLFGSIPEDGNVIVCGGEEDPSHLAAAIRRDVIFNRIDLAAKNKTPTLFLCSDQKLIGEVQEEWAQNDQVLVFGRDLPYAPFSCNRGIDEAIEIAKMFESWGVDMLNVNTGTYDTFYYCVSPYYLPKGYNIQYAKQVKAAVHI